MLHTIRCNIKDLFRVSFLDQGRFFCRATENENTKIFQIHKLSHTCLRLSFLYFYGWKVDVPSMKRNLFDREILLNPRLR